MNHVPEILIVEDEAFTAMSLRLELERAGYNVCSILSTGEQAVSFTKDNKPDYILMDIRLGGEIDGIEAAEQIKSSQNLPIIFMSGYDDKSSRQRAQKLNPLSYLVKPITLGDLTDVLESVDK